MWINNPTAFYFVNNCFRGHPRWLLSFTDKYAKSENTSDIRSKIILLFFLAMCLYYAVKADMNVFYWLALYLYEANRYDYYLNKKNTKLAIDIMDSIQTEKREEAYEAQLAEYLKKTS